MVNNWLAASSGEQETGWQKSAIILPGTTMTETLRLRDDLLALFLMLAGLGCIIAWGVCQVVGVLRAYRLGREVDAIKLHVVRSGRLPDVAPMVLARDYPHLRFLGIVGNLLLFAGIAVMIMAHMVIL